MPSPTVFIVIQQGSLVTTGGTSTDELVLSTPVTLYNLDDTGVSTWSWELTVPVDSYATLTSNVNAISGFTPDVVGTYLVKLTVNGVQAARVGGAVKTAALHYRIPAATEEAEFDPNFPNLPFNTGWSNAVNTALQVIDDGYAAFLDMVPPLTGVQFAALIEDPVGDTSWEKLSGDKILDKYAITSFQKTGATVVEVGSTVTAPAFTASYNRPAVSASVNDGTNVDVITLPATSFAYNGSSLPSRNYTKTIINQQQIFTLLATDAYGAPTATANIQWEPLVFYGSQVAFGDFAASFPNGDFEDLTSAPWVFTPNTPDAYVNVTNTGANYIVNGDFELGNLNGWTIVSGLDAAGSGLGTATGVAVATTIDKHSGTYSMLLGSNTLSAFAGDISASQNIDIPLLGTTTLSFWFKTSAPDGIAYDWFQAHIRNAAGTVVLQDLFAYPIAVGDSSLAHRATPTGGSNTPPLGEIGPVFYNSANSPSIFSSWIKITADLTSYAGQTVKLFFLAEDDNATPAPTRLFIDDIQLTNTYPHSGTKFGEISSSAGGGGTIHQTILIPSGTTFVDGYYRAYGNSGAGSGDSQFILLMDSLLSSTLATIVNVDGYSAPNDWQYFSYDVSAYAGTTIAIVAKVQSTILAGLRALEIDDFNIATTGADIGGYLTVLSSQLQPSKISASLTTTINNNEYFIWVGPASYNAVADNFIDAETGLPIGMIKTNASIDVTNLYGVIIPYDIWQSEYGSFGQFTFVVRSNNE